MTAGVSAPGGAVADRFRDDRLDAVRATLPEEPAFFIDGRFREVDEDRVVDVVSPVDGRPFARVAHATSEDVDAAVAAARRSFGSGVWAKAAPRSRAVALLEVVRLLRERRESLGLLITSDCGKTISDAVGEVDHAADVLEFFATYLDKSAGEVMPTAADALALVTRVPIGVVAAVVPWNYPLSMTMWKCAPALAAGNSVIVKPPEQSPLPTLALARLIAEAGLPDGVFNVVPGLGPVAGAALGLHPDVDKVAFTGSTATGKRFLEYSAASNMKIVTLECGGKSPNLILSSCTRLDEACEGALRAAFTNQGEVCSAGTRLIVEQGVYDDVMARILDLRRQWMPGNPYAADATMGAIVDETQVDTIERYVQIGVDEGQTLAAGGSRQRCVDEGYYYEPTIFTDVSNDARVAREEIFGPVLCVIPVPDEETAVAVANDSVYGLAAAVWTDDLRAAHRVSDRLHAGTVWVNTWTDADVNVPFGGFGQSGNGRDKSIHALHANSQLKTTWMNLR